MELLKGCKRCNGLPKFSTYSFGYHESYAVVCCTTISDKEKDLAIMKWNRFNMESTSTFRLNTETKQWEPYANSEVPGV